jgi:hypothetical protein
MRRLSTEARIWVFGSRHRHEREPDGEQHLIEFVAAIQSPIQQAFQHDAAECNDHDGDCEGKRKRHGIAHHQRGHDVAAGGGEDAMRQVGDAHQPHCHRQSDRNEVQHHREGQAVEGDAGDGGQYRVHAPRPPV